MQTEQSTQEFQEVRSPSQSSANLLTTERIPISVFILTKNEEQDLPGCLASVSWADEICVLDSHSSDETVAIAQQMGAKVYYRIFDNWSEHQNWALANIPFEHDWVLYLDADERVSEEMRESLVEAIRNPGDCVAFRVRRRDYLKGTWLKYSQTSPFYVRLFLPSRIRYERLVNPCTIVDGPLGMLRGHLDHYPFSKGIRFWVERHNAYSSLEAQQILANRTRKSTFRLSKALLAGNLSERRFHQKELFHRLPGRPFLKFVLIYVVRLGFLDGRAGLIYATLQSLYEYLILVKTSELISAGSTSRRGLPK